MVFAVCILPRRNDHQEFIHLSATGLTGSGVVAEPLGPFGVQITAGGEGQQLFEDGAVAHADIYRFSTGTVQGQPPLEGIPGLPLVETVYWPGMPLTTARTA